MASTEQQARAYLDMLDARLRARSSQIALWEDYYEGLHRLQFATSRFRATFGNLFREFADNWCELIVSASVERLKVIGFQTEDGSTQADAEASKIWRDNFMDSEAKIAFTEAVKLGEAYYLIDQENRAYDTDSPLITVEHPAQAICATLPSNRRVRVAGLKEWTEDDGRVCATIYMPDVIYRFQADESGGEQHPGPTASGVQWPTDYLSTPSAGSGSKVTWVPREGVPFVVLNSLKVVPLVPLQNNPTLKVGGRSDIAVVIPLQDAVNKLVTDMIIASEFASFAQRWVTGIEIPRDPETGKALNRQDFLASVARVWAVEDQDAKFGQFQASDLRNYVHAIEMMIQHVAALTRTPPHYLLGQSGNFPSGDSLTATETGLVAKVRGKHSDFNPSNCEMMNLAFRAKGVSGRRCQTTIWGDPEQRIRSQRIDGGIKMTTAGVPQDAVWEEFGTSPEEIERWHQMKTEMGLDPHSTEYAVRPEWETHAEAEKKTPVNTGPQGNLEEQQEAVPSPETEDEIDVPEGAENPDAVRNLIKTERASAKAANRRARELEAQLRQRDEAERPLEDRLADATREAEQARLNTMRYEVAAETGLPLQLASRLTGSSKDELVADADKLKQLVGAPAPLVPPEGGVHQPPPAKGDPIAEHNNLLATLLSQRNAPGVATVPGRDPLAGLLPAPVED